MKGGIYCEIKGIVLRQPRFTFQISPVFVIFSDAARRHVV